MKKLLIALFSIVCFASIASAKPVTFTGAAGSYATTYTCKVDTYMFAYDGDYDGDTDKACFISGAANKDGTIVDATVTSSYVEFSAVNDYILWVVAGEDGINDEGPITIYFSMYIVDDTNGDLDENVLVESVSNSDNMLVLYTSDASDSVAVTFESGGTKVAIISTVDPNMGAWYRVGYSYQTGVAGNDHAISVVTLGNAPNWEETDSDLVAWDFDADDITIGEKSSAKNVTDTVRIKDLCVLSGYKTADIF